MIERLSPKGKTLLEEKRRRLDEQLRKRILDYGSAVGSGAGDSYHDEQAYSIYAEIVTLQAKLNSINRFSSCQELKPPNQFEMIEVGHQVKVEFSDDPEPREEISVTILPEGDVLVLNEFYDQRTKFLVSDKSPIGRALLGKRVGEEARYETEEGNFGVIVKGISLADVFG